MLITQDVAEQKLCRLIEGISFSFVDWKGERFEKLKFASATEKGDVGEDFLAVLFRELGYSDVEVVRNRRGPYDVRVRNGTREIKFEVKVATQDIHKNFQFNGIRFDTQYTHLFCLGISPRTVWYQVVHKEWLVGRDEYRMVSMSKGANAAFKLTRREDQMTGFDQFEAEIGQLLGPRVDHVRGS